MFTTTAQELLARLRSATIAASKAHRWASALTVLLLAIVQGISAAGEHVTAVRASPVFRLALAPQLRLRGGASIEEMEISGDTSFKENFEFLGSQLSIKQDTCSGHSACIWDAARVLAK